MKRLPLLMVLCLVAEISGGSFEIEDPAAELQEFINEAEKAAATSKPGINKGVIIPAGIELFIPVIEQDLCKGWRFDESEPFADIKTGKHYTTQKTYIGDSIKTIRCTAKPDNKTLELTLIRIDESRLIWVESDRVIAVN